MNDQHTKEMRHAAVYYRVSTDRQDYESQKMVVEEWLKMQKSKPKITVIEDYARSGADKNRPGYKKLMELIRSGKIDTVIVYRLDRFSRDATSAIRAILEMDELGVAFVAVGQEALNLGHKVPFRRAILAIFAELAEIERSITIERVKAGLAAARKRGVKFGAPIKVSAEVIATVVQKRKEGATFKQIAKAVGLSVGSVHSAFLNAEKILNSSA